MLWMLLPSTYPAPPPPPSGSWPSNKPLLVILLLICRSHFNQPQDLSRKSGPAHTQEPSHEAQLRS